jgi:predicted Ser/Thr protein kinase
MAHYSDRYLNSGVRKGEVERFQRQIIGSITAFEIGITDFEAAGDRAYLTGFVSTYFGKGMLQEISIIKENGEWKWYGNQRDVSP